MCLARHQTFTEPCRAADGHCQVRIAPGEMVLDNTVG